MTDIESRVAELERSNCRLRRGLLSLTSIMVVVVLSAADSDESRFHSVVTKKILIGDASVTGNTVIVMEAMDGNSASIELQRITDKRPKTLASLGTKGGATVLTMRDPKSLNLIKIAIDGDTATVEGNSPGGVKQFLLSADDRQAKIFLTR